MSDDSKPAREIDMRKITIAVLEHFIENEGTDYMGQKGEPEDAFRWPQLSEAERAELTQLRDEARKNTKWDGYK